MISAAALRPLFFSGRTVELSTRGWSIGSAAIPRPAIASALILVLVFALVLRKTFARLWFVNPRRQHF